MRDTFGGALFCDAPKGLIALQISVKSGKTTRTVIIPNIGQKYRNLITYDKPNELQKSFGVESSPHKSTLESAFERVKGWFKGE